jgi:hypothetical protein
MKERDPIFEPRPGDIVRSSYESIGERHVMHVSDCGVEYLSVKLKGQPNGHRPGYCLPRIWTKWCRAHRVDIIQRAPVTHTDPAGGK